MKKIVLFFAGLILFSSTVLSYGQEDTLAELEGISLGMRASRLIDSWGYPSKREIRDRMEVWYYANENTPHPTDGILVYLKKGRVEKWHIVDNMYREMKIWGEVPGESP